MENANTNYIMVSADDISRDLYIFYRDLIFGGWFESYSISDRISASDIFSKFNIPEDYQKIIISLEAKLRSLLLILSLILHICFVMEKKNI